MRRFTRIEELRQAVGEELGASDWLRVDQRRIDGFAEATGERHWLHVDPARAVASAFGGTIAHGLLTLSVLTVLAKSVYSLREIGDPLIVGFDGVRFPAPVPVDARIRSRIAFTAIEDRPSGVRVSARHVVEIEGGAAPACIAVAITHLVPAADRRAAHTPDSGTA